MIFFALVAVGVGLFIFAGLRAIAAARRPAHMSSPWGESGAGLPSALATIALILAAVVWFLPATGWTTMHSEARVALNGPALIQKTSYSTRASWSDKNIPVWNALSSGPFTEIVATTSETGHPERIVHHQVATSWWLAPRTRTLHEFTF